MHYLLLALGIKQTDTQLTETIMCLQLVVNGRLTSTITGSNKSLMALARDVTGSGLHAWKYGTITLLKDVVPIHLVYDN